MKEGMWEAAEKVFGAKKMKTLWEKEAKQIKTLHELEEENKSLQSQLKEKEETMNKLKEWLDQEYEDCNKIGNPAIGYAMGQIRRVKTKIQELEILSKGENK